MKPVLLLLAISTFFIRTFACLNEHHISRHGHSTIDAFSMYDIRFERGFDPSTLEKELAELRSRKETDPAMQLYNRNDIAVKLIKLGRYTEAKHILDSLYKKHPSDYSVVVNLGTLYELMGENQKALQLIREAVRLNEDSHSGSEWFHISVLEYKLRNRTTDQIPGDNILSLPAKKKEPFDLASGVAWQLNERIPFTPVPDPMMAKILLEFGDYLADSLTIKGAYVIYGIAGEYDPLRQLPLAERRQQLLPLFKKYKISPPDYHDFFETAVVKKAAEQRSEAAGKLIENGISWYSDYQHEKKEKAAAKRRTRLKTAAITMAVLVVAGAAIFALRQRKRKATI